jgi:hypothetical protein
MNGSNVSAAGLVVEALKRAGFTEINRRPDGKVYMTDDPIHGGTVIGYLIDDFDGITVWNVEEEDNA